MMNYNISEIHRAVESIKPYLDEYKVVLFNGPMGAGKTTLISALCRSLGSTDDLSSPTFSIVNEYDSQAGTIYHFDFYRIDSIEEAFDFGVEEYLYSDKLCFLEWSEKIEELLPTKYLIVNIEVISETERTLNIKLYKL
jgi:tRNA threonylcarbamoyladenosine biosynthesis protein TsaE